MGDLATDAPWVEELLKANEAEVVRRVFPEPTPRKKKRLSLIRPGLQPQAILRVGGVSERWVTLKDGRKVQIGAEGHRKGDSFKKWFGNSKVVDKKGNPLIVYHGEPIGATNSEIKNDKYRVGRFFSSSPDVAGAYGPKVFKAYLKMDKPFVVDAKENLYDDIPTPKQMRGWLGTTRNSTDLTVEWAFKHGYDGAIIRNVYEPNKPVRANDYVPFRLAQIRNADEVKVYEAHSGHFLTDAYFVFHPSQVRKADDENIDEGWVTLKDGRKILIGAPEETISREGWLTVDGKFHPNMPGQGHQQTVEDLGFGHTHSAVVNALKDGNVRVVAMEDKPPVQRGELYRHVGFDAQTNDEATRALISNALGNIHGVKSVTVDFRKFPSASFDKVTPEAALTFLNNKSGVPTDVMNWHVAAEQARLSGAEGIEEVWITKEGRKILIGAGIYRTSGNVDSVAKIPPMCDRPEARAFERKIPDIANEYKGVTLNGTTHAAGVWESNREPSLMISATVNDGYAADALAAMIGESAPEKQMAMAVFSENSKGAGSMYELSGITNHEGAVQTLLKHGFDGQSVVYGENRIILLDANSSMGQNISRASRELGHPFSTTSGDIEFIGEEAYGQKQKDYEDYRKGLGEAKEGSHLHTSHLQEARRQVRQKRHKPLVYLPSPTDWTVGQLAIPYNVGAMGENVRREKKIVRVVRKKTVPYVNQLGQRYWMGIGGGLRSQYGDYNSTQNPVLRLVTEGGNWVTIDGRKVLIGGAPHQKTKAEYIGAAKVPEGLTQRITDGTATKEEEDAWLAARQAERVKEKEWENSVLGAVSEGKLTPEQVIEKGISKYDVQDFVPLPDTLYHATVAADQVDAQGLKTRDEQGVSGGAGLGGGTDNTISLTSDPKVASGILDGMKEAHDVVTGKLPVSEMLKQAQDGTDAKQPWASKLEDYWKGAYGSVDKLAQGIETDTGFPKLPEEKPGWTPVKSSENTYTDGSPSRYSQWERPMTGAEKSDNAFSFYKAWSLFREEAGGKYDPFFAFNDREAFASVKPENIDRKSVV